MSNYDLNFLASLKLTPLISDYSKKDRFESTHPKLNEFYYKYALTNQQKKLSQTIVVLHGNNIVGYFSLLTDALPLSRSKARKHFHFPFPIYPYYPAIKIGRLAVHKDYCKREIGTFMVMHVILIAISINNKVGCRFVTVDALKESVGFYEKEGFIITKNKDIDPIRKEPEDTTFMYLDINDIKTRPLSLAKMLIDHMK